MGYRTGFFFSFAFSAAIRSASSLAARSAATLSAFALAIVAAFSSASFWRITASAAFAAAECSHQPRVIISPESIYTPFASRSFSFSIFFVNLPSRSACSSFSSHTFLRLSISPLRTCSTPALISSGISVGIPNFSATEGFTIHGEASEESRSTQSRRKRLNSDLENTKRSRLRYDVISVSYTIIKYITYDIALHCTSIRLPDHFARESFPSTPFATSFSRSLSLTRPLSLRPLGT